MDEQRKILMIGNKDSGKTTYMASAYGIMKSGKFGFRVYGDHDSDAWLMKLYNQIKIGQYPIPTDKRGKFNFDLYYYQQKVLSFEWIDYFGGVITESRSDELLKDIDEADAIMIFLEAPALAENKKSITQFRRIQSLITEKLTSMDRHFDVIVVITKYDLVGESIPFETVCGSLNNLKNGLSSKDNIYFRIVPVSCTSSGFVNVDLPLIDILHTGLGMNYVSHALLANAHAEKAVDFNNRRGIIDWVVSRLFGAKTNGELAEEHLQAALAEKKLWEELETPFEQLDKYRKNYNIEIPVAKKQSTSSQANRRSRFRNM